jgi:hypothetical protein
MSRKMARKATERKKQITPLASPIPALNRSLRISPSVRIIP